MKLEKTVRASALVLAVSLATLLAPSLLDAQTAATGAITGTVRDATGAVVAGATVTAKLLSTGETRQTDTNSEGVYRIALLTPGPYNLTVAKQGFKTAVQSSVPVAVTETETVDLRLEIGSITERIEVSAQPEMAQTESSALGRVADERDVLNLPLVSRNYTQILSLSPGVIAPVNNATELGRGNGGLSGIVGSFGNDASVHANGMRSIDNNFQMNGLQVNDLNGSAGGSGGVPIPNPDTIQEFKVQTGQYDATFGRNAGANVDLVTKSGTNTFHGNLFEFFRNTALNANDFFANEAGAPRGALNQNQFGGTLGGPIVKNKLLLFGSYQGTRQKNGIAASCFSTQILPPLTDDRSGLAIATIFAGQRGLFQNEFGGVGPAIDPTAPNGNGTANPYNINPVSLALLQLKLPNGNFLIPTPHSANGLTILQDPCNFNEDQYLGDVDYVMSNRSTFFFRYFIANSNQTVTFPSSGITSNAGTLGSPNVQPERFQAFAFGHTYMFSSSLINEFRMGFHRTVVSQNQKNPFSYSTIGATVSPVYDDLPSIYIGSCCLAGGGADDRTIQGSWDLVDSVSWSHGKHNIRFGGGVTRGYLDQRNFRFNGIELYPTFPDFLLGLNGFQNGTASVVAPFSNILVTIDFLGLSDRDERTWDGAGYIQDDIKLTRRFTFNIGLRYERIGELGDEDGRNGNFDPALANPNPPAGGTLAGFTVPSNYNGLVPLAVTQLNNNLGIKGLGKNGWGPRVGFAWQVLPDSDRFVVRSGYGIFYTRPVGAAVFETTTAPPFGLFRLCVAVCNLFATAANPFQPAPPLSAFPLFQAYSPSTNQTVMEMDQNFRPPITQQYSLGLQSSLSKNYLFEVGYVGSRSTKIIRQRGLNQALSASPADPVRGQVDNTVANIPDRLPYIGFSSDATGINQIESAGASWYNALQASVTKRYHNGLQFLASYTFSKELDTDGVDPEWGSAGGTSSLGNQSDIPNTRYGPGNFNRKHRFVVSYVYDFPSPKERSTLKGRVLGDWSVSGVTTIQSGQYLTLTGSSGANVFGISSDRIQIAPGCTNGQLMTSGSLNSRLSNYFNGSCIDRQNLAAPLDVVNGTNLPVWPVIGADGTGTGFGNSGVGIVTGPGQDNYDMCIQKVIPIRESMTFLFRAEFFNAFNKPQFANPDVSTADATFGQILATSVNPRIIQFAVKLNF
jgi:hypothetical protein